MLTEKKFTEMAVLCLNYGRKHRKTVGLSLSNED
jgi:hypothetical protein